MQTRRQITEMARFTRDDQVTQTSLRTRLAGCRRAVALVTLASALLAGCSTPVARQATATGVTDAGDARTISDQARQHGIGARKAELVPGDSDYRNGTFRCISRPADCRIRDLRTPWEERRYLMPDGTLSAPPSSEAPR